MQPITEKWQAFLRWFHGEPPEETREKLDQLVRVRKDADEADREIRSRS